MQNKFRDSMFFLLLTGVMCAGQAQAEDAGRLAKHSLSWKRSPHLTSRWVEEMSLETPLPEYPRPTMVREEWKSLNGEWDFLGNGHHPPPTSRHLSRQSSGSLRHSSHNKRFG